MKKTINNSYEFIDEFIKYKRKGNFTNEGLHALFDYIEGLEGVGLEEYTLDVIEICTTFTEYESIKELKESYIIDELDITDYKESLEEYFTNVVVVDYADGTIGFIIQE